MNTKWKIILLTVLALGALVALLYQGGGDADPARHQPLLLYCAAGIKPAVDELVRDYEGRAGVRVEIRYGGSNELYAQLRLSGRGDLYLAGDSSYLERGREQGLVAEIIPLARMGLVVAVPKERAVEIRTIEDLLRDDPVTGRPLRVALGSPDQTAVGRATRRLLEKAGVWSRLEERVRAHGVFKPTVPLVANDVEIGAADAGLVFDATVRQRPGLDMVRLSCLEGSEQLVAVGVLRSSGRPAAALRLARYLESPEYGQGAFETHGYRAVPGDAWAERPEIVLFSGGLNRVAIQETLARFQEREGVRITTVYDGCGRLVGEMKAGQRPDLYFACDASYMREVADLFASPREISETDMVLLVRGEVADQIDGLADLARPGLRVAVANPAYSALGGLTVRLLREAGLYDKIKTNITYGDAPTADWLTARVKTAREDVAVVYRANTIGLQDVRPPTGGGAKDEGSSEEEGGGLGLRVVEIDHPLARAIQPIAVAKATHYPHLAERLVQAILAVDSQKAFESHGFRWRARR